MIAALVVLALLVVGQWVVGIVAAREQRAEREALLRMVIARHAGEVIALEREDRKPKAESERTPLAVVEGL